MQNHSLKELIIFGMIFDRRVRSSGVGGGGRHRILKIGLFKKDGNSLALHRRCRWAVFEIQQDTSITWCDVFRPTSAQKLPETITSHDVLEPLKEALLASRDVIISSQNCGSNRRRLFTLSDACCLPRNTAKSYDLEASCGIFGGALRGFYQGNLGSVRPTFNAIRLKSPGRQL